MALPGSRIHTRSAVIGRPRVRCLALLSVKKEVSFWISQRLLTSLDIQHNLVICMGVYPAYPCELQLGRIETFTTTSRPSPTPENACWATSLQLSAFAKVTKTNPAACHLAWAWPSSPERNRGWPGQEVTLRWTNKGLEKYKPRAAGRVCVCALTHTLIKARG